MGAVFGTLLGDWLFMGAAVAGLATLLQAHPALFQFIQWVGAAYLIVLGIQMSFARGTDTLSRTVHNGFRQAFFISLTNPKVILFFMAFFPLFLPPHASWITLFGMMVHVTVLSLLYQTALVWIGYAVAQWARTVSWIGPLVTRLAGIAFIGFALAQIGSFVNN